MILPGRSPAIIRFTAAWLRKKRTLRLTFITSSQSCSVKSTASARRMMPALFTRMSTGPSAASVSSRIRSIGSMEVRSAWTETAFRPLARTLPTVSSDARRATEATSAPAAARARAMP